MVSSASPCLLHQMQTEATMYRNRMSERSVNYVEQITTLPNRSACVPDPQNCNKSSHVGCVYLDMLIHFPCTKHRGLPSCSHVCSLHTSPGAYLDTIIHVLCVEVQVSRCFPHFSFGYVRGVQQLVPLLQMMILCTKATSCSRALLTTM